MIVVVDYFTKWVEVGLIASIIAAHHKTFVYKNILCNFGMPMLIITNDEQWFKGGKFEQLCVERMFKHSKATISYNETNDQVEYTNHTIIDNLKKKLESAIELGWNTLISSCRHTV